MNIVYNTHSIRVNSDFIKHYCSDLHLPIEVRSDEDDIAEVDEDMYHEVLARYTLYINEINDTANKSWFVAANIANYCLSTWRFNTLKEAQEKRTELLDEGHAVSIFFGYTY